MRVPQELTPINSHPLIILIYISELFKVFHF